MRLSLIAYLSPHEHLQIVRRSNLKSVQAQLGKQANNQKALGGPLNRMSKLTDYAFHVHTLH